MLNAFSIGFDAKRLFYNSTGLGNYSRDLLRVLLMYYPQYSYRLFARHKMESKYDPEFLKLLTEPSTSSKLWRQWMIYKDINTSSIDVFHGLSAELPLSIHKTNVAKVVTIHDVIFKKFPHWYPAIDRNVYDFKTKAACQKADSIIAISQKTKEDIIELYHVDANKIHVVYQNCSSHFNTLMSQSEHRLISEKWKLPETYILSVGRIEKRKNLMLIARALEEIDSEVHWVCVGSDKGEKSTIINFLRKRHLLGRVVFLEDIPLKELVSMYNQALALVYVSHYEGFGIPVLEGIRCGIPVISSDSSCLQEVAGEDGLYIHPDEPEQLSTCIMKLYTDEVFRETIIRSQFVHSEMFSDVRFAEDTMAVYKKTI